MKFLYHDILISILHYILYCMISALHVIVLLPNNKFDLMNTFIVMVHDNFRPQVHIMIYVYHIVMKMVPIS